MIGRILLAEDDGACRRLVASALRADGYEVIEAADGAQALDAIADALASSQLPDVVVSDVSMPYLSGLHVIASLHGIDATIPTIVTTAFGDATTHAAAIRLGAELSLDKPFDLDVLRVAIARIVAACRLTPRSSSTSSARSRRSR